ncbi:hypothetical protein ACP70R_032477 [Stipagrostis hirtigluma subsp. patula]
MAAAPKRIEIDWKEVFGADSSASSADGGGGGDDVCFATPSPAPAARAAAKGSKRGGRDAGARRPLTRLQSLLGVRDSGAGVRSRRALLERRPGAVDKAGGGYGRDAFDDEFDTFKWSKIFALVLLQDRKTIGELSLMRLICENVAGNACYSFGGPQDEEGEQVSPFRVKPSLVRKKKNNGQLDTKNKESVRRVGDGQRKPIPVGKMYSNKPCLTGLSGLQQRVHAIDPTESVHEKCRQSENHSFVTYAKRRKEQHRDLSSLSSQKKAEDVVLLDDEDMQPEEQVDPGKQKESKIYYPSRDDPEAVELASSDIKCLDPGVFLSSPVINYYIQYIKKNKLHNEGCRDKFYIFNTYFYSKLEEALDGKGDFLKLRRWWKGVNIFRTAYIIVPIHGMAHWSLIIICIPAKESNSGPIILHLDSLEMHPSTKIFNIVERYLESEWRHLKKNPLPDTSISDSIWEDLPRNILRQKIRVPQQNNAYDCGIFMLYYIERFIREAPERLTRDKLDMFSRSWFNSEDASELRPTIRRLLLKEFKSARLDDAMSDKGASDGSDIEDSIKGGELEAATLSDSSEMIVESAESGDTGSNNEGFKVAAADESSGESAGTGKSKDAAIEEASGESGGTGKTKDAAIEEDSGESGGTGKSKDAAIEEDSGESGGVGKSNVGTRKVAALDEAPTSSSRRDEKTKDCVLSEAASFSDSVNDEEDVKADSGSSKTEELFVIVSPERSENKIINSMPCPDIVIDSCDSDTDDVEITRVTKRRMNLRSWLHKLT